jgi:dihydrofolate reductase
MTDHDVQVCPCVSAQRKEVTTMTRRTTAHLFCSVNGVVESPNLFQFDAFGPEEGQMMGRTIATVTDVVIGRRLWQEWVGFWPGADDPFGAFINPVRKHVVTSTLSGELEWNSVVADGDPVSYVKKLQQEGEGDIAVAGGIETVRSLFLAGVVDSLTLTVHPAVTNEGRRLFDESVPLTRLTLLEGATTSAGNAVLSYALRR